MIANGDLPRWVARALLWALCALVLGAGTWISGIPSLGTRVTAIETANREIRQEIQQGFAALTQRIDRAMETRRLP